MRVSKELLRCVSLHPQRDRIMKATARQNGYSQAFWQRWRSVALRRPEGTRAGSPVAGDFYDALLALVLPGFRARYPESYTLSMALHKKITPWALAG